jgi:quinol monooxygenase YgiN
LKVGPGEVRADLGQDTLAGAEASGTPDVLLSSTGFGFQTRSMEACMLTDWISPESLAAVNEGFVVAIMLEAKEGESDTLAEILRVMTVPTMAEPGVKLFLPYRSPTNKSLFFVFELYVNEAGWAAHEATDHFKAAIKELLPRVTRRERVPFIPFLKA